MLQACTWGGVCLEYLVYFVVDDGGDCAAVLCQLLLLPQEVCRGGGLLQSLALCSSQALV